jgi:hypothetical protein
LSQNKALILRSETELWSKGNLTAADELYSASFVCHFIAGTEWRELEGIKSDVASHRAAFPDWSEKVDDIVAEGDRVVIRFISSGTLFRRCLKFRYPCDQAALVEQSSS